MTDRINALIVVLREDTRDDDVQALMNAMELFKNVCGVTKNVVSPGDFVAETRARARLGAQMWDILFKDTKVVP